MDHPVGCHLTKNVSLKRTDVAAPVLPQPKAAHENRIPCARSRLALPANEPVPRCNRRLPGMLDCMSNATLAMCLGLSVLATTSLAQTPYVDPLNHWRVEV